MSTVGTAAVSEAYSLKFDNLDEITHPSIFFLPSFGELLQKAIDRGSPLTRDEVESQFGELAWDW
jgi:hypothetical protein